MKLTVPQALLLNFIALSDGKTTNEAVAKANLSFVPIRGLRDARLVHTAYQPSGLVSVWVTRAGQVIAGEIIRRKSVLIKPVNLTKDQFLVSIINDVIKEFNKMGSFQ
jgi:hypothetical protein